MRLFQKICITVWLSLLFVPSILFTFSHLSKVMKDFLHLGSNKSSFHFRFPSNPRLVLDLASWLPCFWLVGHFMVMTSRVEVGVDTSFFRSLLPVSKAFWLTRLEDEISLICFVNLLIVVQQVAKKFKTLFSVRSNQLLAVVCFTINSSIPFRSLKQAKTEPSLWSIRATYYIVYIWLRYITLKINETLLQVWDNHVLVSTLRTTFRPQKWWLWLIWLKRVRPHLPHSPGVWSFVSFPRP